LQSIILVSNVIGRGKTILTSEPVN